MARENNDVRKNGSGYYDPTAYKAIMKTDSESERFHKLLETIFNICELSGFRLKGRITVEDLETGKIWR